MAPRKVRDLRRRLQMVNPNKTQDVQDVVFDLETTGLKSHIHEITQLAAMTSDKRASFNVYIMPSKRIPPVVVRMTGIDVVTVRGQRRMRVDKQPIESSTLQEAMEKFVDFLKTNRNGETGKINLIAHNGVNFDCRFLYTALLVTNLLPEFEKVVVSVTDTLHVFQDDMPERYSHKQADLVNDLLPELEYHSHNALNDVEALTALLPKVRETYHIQDCTYTLQSVIAAIRF